MTLNLPQRNLSLPNNPLFPRNKKRSRGGDSIADTPSSDSLQKDMFSYPKDPNFPPEHDGDSLERDLPSDKFQQFTSGSISNITSNPISSRNNPAMITILSDLYFIVKKLKEVKHNPQDIVLELEKLITYY